jgi:hypothetical protein
MYFNINITGSSYTQATGIIQLSIHSGIPPYLVNYRNFDGTSFSGLKIDDGTYVGYPQYTKAINVPIGFYYIDVIDKYGSGIKLTECVIVEYSGYTQLNIDNTPPEEEIITFTCETETCRPEIECHKPLFYWLQTEDGCNINLEFNECLDSCFLIGTHCIPPDGCGIIDEMEYFMADECGWTIILEDGNPPM